MLLFPCLLKAHGFATDARREKCIHAGTAGCCISTAIKPVGIDITSSGLLAPTVTTSPGITVINLGQAPPDGVAIDPGITVTDDNDGILSAVTVSFNTPIDVNNPAAMGEALQFANTGNFTGSLTVIPGTVMLTITPVNAQVTTAQWQDALRTVRYVNTNALISTIQRTIEFKISGILDGVSYSATAQKQLQVENVDENLVLQTTPGAAVYNPFFSSTFTIDPGISVSVLNNAVVSHATVSILGGHNILAAERLSFTGDPVTMGNIAGVFDNLKGILDLTSAGNTATAAQWQAALAAVTYSVNGNAVNKRSADIRFMLFNGGAYSLPADKRIDIKMVTLVTPAQLNGKEDVPMGFSGISLRANAFTTLNVCLEVKKGKIYPVEAQKSCVTGREDQIDIRLRQLTYRQPQDGAEDDELKITVTDANGALMEEITIPILMEAVNDVPVITAPGEQRTPMNTPISFSIANNNAITVSDVDAGNNYLFMSLNVSGGLIQMSVWPGPISNLSGDIAFFNHELKKLLFIPHQGYTGPAYIEIYMTDLGNSGSGGDKTATTRIPIVVTPPVAVITSVKSSNSDGAYGIGKTIAIGVRFNKPVIVNTTTGTPSLLLETGDTDRAAVYKSGTGTDELLFEYTVQPGDFTGRLEYASAAALVNADISAAGEPAVLTLPAPGSNSIGGQNDIVIDGIRPGTLIASGAPDPVNGQFEVTVTFTEPVNGVNVNAVNGTVTTISDNASTVFTLLVKPLTDGTVELQLPENTVTDAAGNGNTAGNIFTRQYERISPRITALTAADQDGSYGVGAHLTFRLTFSEAVQVNGDAFISFATAPAPAKAQYLSGSGTNELTFRYTVAEGELAPRLDYVDADALSGDIISLSNNAPAILTLPAPGSSGSVGGQKEFVIDGVPPGVSITSAATGLVNDPFSITITFMENVTGFTEEDMIVSNGTVSGFTAHSTTTFTALVTPAGDGEVTVSIPAGVANDAAANGNTAGIPFSLRYQYIPSSVVAVTSTANDGLYGVGADITITVRFSKAVQVTGSPFIRLSMGAIPARARYQDGSGTNELRFTYSVQPGDATDRLEYISAAALNGTITSVENNRAAVLVLPEPGSANALSGGRYIRIDGIAPVLQISSSAPDPVNAPFAVSFRFSENVNGFTAGSIQAANGALSDLRMTGGGVYTAMVTPAADGPVRLTVAANTVKDDAGNINDEESSFTRSYNGTKPVITAGQSFTINERSAAGTLVGRVTAVYTGSNGPLQQWRLSGSTAFAIDPQTGDIKVNDEKELDHTSHPSFMFTVTTSDGVNTSEAVPVTVHLNFVNLPPLVNAVADQVACLETASSHSIRVNGISGGDKAPQAYTLVVQADSDIFGALSISDEGNGNALISYRMKTSGTAQVTIIIKDNGGTANGGRDETRQRFIFTAHPLPEIKVSAEGSTTISKGDQLRLRAEGGISYLWKDAAGLQDTRNAAPLVRPAVTTIYEVTAVTAAGCSAGGSITVTVNEDYRLNATNLLTPNGDGINDTWVIPNIDMYPQNEVIIFDRSGRVVYKQQNYSNTWNGTVNGQPLSEGTYYYILEAGPAKKRFKGFITIVRDRR